MLIKAHGKYNQNFLPTKIKSLKFANKQINMVSVDKIEQILAECKRDVLKTIAGNQAAGVRLRKAMQNIKTAANEVRDEVLNMRAKG